MEKGKKQRQTSLYMFTNYTKTDRDVTVKATMLTIKWKNQPQ